MTRREKPRETVKRFLIMCEGENTEPCYFKLLRDKLGLPANQIVVDVEHHSHTNPIGILQDAIDARGACAAKVKAAKKKGDTREREYDAIWIVFDTEGPQNGRAGSLKAVRADATNDGIDVAESTPSFEVWYLLHVKPSPPACSTATDAEKALTAVFAAANKKQSGACPEYGKSKAAAEAAAKWALAEARTFNAVKNARATFTSGGMTRTGVHLLVEALRAQATPAAQKALGWP
jgi:tRNA(Met) C34 N-acetyltransferase TmcA